VFDPDKLSVGQSNDDRDGSKPMVGTTNRIHGVADVRCLLFVRFEGDFVAKGVDGSREQ
jgi:hypothetical protein